MASQISPGIILRERDITTATIVGAQALTGAIATTFVRGPVDVLTEIDSQRQLLDTFGLPNEKNAEDWFVASEFLNYGGRLSVVRALTDGLRTANTAGDTNLVVKNEVDWVGQVTPTKFAARTPGKWGDSLQVVVVDRGADVYVELAEDLEDQAAAVGSEWTFSNGAQGYVLSWDAAARKAAIVLQAKDAEGILIEPSVGDTVNDGGPGESGIRTFTDGIAAPAASIDIAVDPSRTPGTYTVTDTDAGAPGAPATFSVVVADASDGSLVAAADVTASSAGGGADAGLAGASYVGVASTSDGSGTLATFNVTRDGVTGAVASVVVNAVGSGYAVGEILTIAAADIGGGAATDLTITLQAADIAVIAGTTTVTLLTDGDDYTVGDTVLLDGASFGAGASSTLTVSALDDDVALTAVYDWYTNTDVQVGELSIPLNSLGVRPGTSQYAADRGIEFDELSVAIVDIDGRVSGTVANVVERVNSLSKLTDGRSTENAIVYYKEIINDQSSYVFHGQIAVLDDAVGTLDAANTGNNKFIAWDQDSVDIVDAGPNRTFRVAGVQSFVLEDGADDYDYSLGEIVAAYDNFATADQTDLDFILMGGSMALEDDTKGKASKVVSIADARKDCIGFVSPHRGNQIGTGGISLSSADQKTNTINFFRTLPSTSFAVFDSGYKYLYDRFNDRFRYIPCNGDVAGLCVNTSRVLYDWYSPAGVARGALKNAIKLAYVPTAADRDDLYTNRINPITILPGTGITLFGDKTALASTSAFDRINVRRLFLNLERRVENLASGVLFEQNDVLTRSSFASAVNSYLSEVQAKRGVTDFLVVCDESNNTPDVIDRNEFVAEIFVKAARSINFVSITFTATKTGVSFAEVVGRG